MRFKNTMVLCVAVWFTNSSFLYPQNADKGVKLNPPTQLVAEVTGRNISLRWLATSSYARADYNIYQSTNGNGIFQKIAVTRDTHYTATNPVSGVVYYFKVTASLNAVAESVSADQKVTVPGIK